MEYTHIEHPFGPLFDSESQILVLGSLPSVKSREQQFFYGHPQNRFWPMLAQVLGETKPMSIPEKRAMALKHHIAMWDTIYSCDIKGSSDASIKNVVPTDLASIVAQSKIQAVFCNGKTSGKYFAKYQGKALELPMFIMPSTSPANAAWTMEKLVGEWQQILTYLR